MSFRDRYHSSGPISGERLDGPLRELMRPGVIALAEDASLHQVLVSKRDGCVPEGVVSELDLLALVWR